MKSITVLRLNKILRKASALMAVLCLVTMLCGCSAGFFSGDLLTSPRLTDEQTEIYNALTASAGRVDCVIRIQARTAVRLLYAT